MLHSTGNGVCAAPEGTIGIHSCWVSVLSSCSSQQNRKMLWKKSQSSLSKLITSFIPHTLILRGLEMSHTPSLE